MVGFASAPSSPKTIYLQVDSSADPDVISMFKTADGGLTWNALTSFLAAGPKPRIPGVTAVDPTNPNTVFAGAILLERSTDGGVTWAYADGSRDQHTAALRQSCDGFHAGWQHGVRVERWRRLDVDQLFAAPR